MESVPPRQKTLGKTTRLDFQLIISYHIDMYLDGLTISDELHRGIARYGIEHNLSYTDAVLHLLEFAVLQKQPVVPTVTCPICGETGPLQKSGDNARCFNCGIGFMPLEK